MRDDTGARPARSDPWPKHHQVYLVLLQQITEGRFGDDGTMPNELQLAQSFSVSRITIRKAMERLEAKVLDEEDAERQRQERRDQDEIATTRWSHATDPEPGR